MYISHISLLLIIPTFPLGWKRKKFYDLLRHHFHHRAFLSPIVHPPTVRVYSLTIILFAREEKKKRKKRRKEKTSIPYSLSPPSYTFSFIAVESHRTDPSSIFFHTFPTLLLLFLKILTSELRTVNPRRDEMGGGGMYVRVEEHGGNEYRGTSTVN